jgi:Na+-transporting NADH:ubiquinone oxidoreductase subunit F
MQYTITVGNHQTLKTEAGKTLFYALSSNGIFVPSACGGQGRCGLCRMIVRGADDSYTDSERLHISNDERIRGMHLSCQVHVHGNLSVELDEESLAAKPYTTKVITIKTLSPHIKEITLQRPPDFTFEAGQFVLFKIPAYNGAALATYRAYSIASTPQNKEILRFLIEFIPEGYASVYLHTILKNNDPIMIVGPYGQFTLRNKHKNMVFIAGGSGAAPMVSFLEYLAATGCQTPISFYLGSKTFEELFYLDEIKKLAAKLPCVTFIPTLDKADTRWAGATGMAPIVAVEKLPQQMAAETEVYLCGGPGLIKNAVRLLLEKGVRPENIYFDKF